MSDSFHAHSQLWERDVVRVHLRGSLTAESYPVLEKEFERWFSQGHYAVVVELQDVEEISNVGGGILVGLIRHAQEKGGHVTVASPRKSAQETFERLGVWSLLHVVTDPRDALPVTKRRDRKSPA